MVTYIMRYLSVSDRKAASLVNKTWYEASCDPLLLKDILVTFHPATAPSTLESAARRTSRPKGSTRDDIHWSTSSLEYLTANLQNLCLKGNILLESNFTRFLSDCQSLRCLDLSACNSLFMSGAWLNNIYDEPRLKKVLMNIQELNLGSLRHLSDCTFNKLLSICTHVESLSLAGNQIIFHSDIYSGFASNLSEAGAAVLTFNNILKYIRTSSSRIKVLNLSRTGVNDKALSELANVTGLHLEELYLVCCRNLTDDGVIELCQKQNKITILDLSQCCDLGDGSLDAIRSHLSGLTQLRLRQCRQVSDRSILKLHTLSNLKHLDLSECYSLSSLALAEGLCSAVDGQMYRTLTHLNLSSSNSVKDCFVAQASMVMPLVHLNLGSCMAVTDVSLLYICKYLSGLRYLDLRWCKHISDLGMLGRLTDEVLSVHEHAEGEGQCNCERRHRPSTVFNKPAKYTQIDQERVSDFHTQLKLEFSSDVQPYTIKNLSRLLFLDLTACPKVTDIGISQVMCLKELRNLSLSMAPRISDLAVVTVAEQCPSIEELSLRQCNKITDVGVIHVAETLHRLQSLDISGCDQLTDQSLLALSCHSNGLKKLDVSFCKGLTVECVETMEADLKSLHSFNKRLVGCSMNDSV